MITSNPGAEFTRKTTIIVALDWLQPEKGGDLTDPNGRAATSGPASRDSREREFRAERRSSNWASRIGLERRCWFRRRSSAINSRSLTDVLAGAGRSGFRKPSDGIG
jgi:hypothetical protein